jgi:hypothetical protein
MDGAAGSKVEILPGIDTGVPMALNHSRCTPQGTNAAVMAALRGGPHGVVLSRKYSEMRLTNLSGAGEAIRELGS